MYASALKNHQIIGNGTWNCCRELLLPGAEVILEDCIEKNPNRKTRYDLIAFVIQMEETSEVRPNTATHPEFGIALEEAKDAGVEVLSLKCHVGMDRLEIIGENEPWGQGSKGERNLWYEKLRIEEV